MPVQPARAMSRSSMGVGPVIGASVALGNIQCDRMPGGGGHIELHRTHERCAYIDSLTGHSAYSFLLSCLPMLDVVVYVTL